MKRPLLLFSVFILCYVEGFAFSTESIPLHLKVTSLTGQKQPEIFGNQLIFSYKPESPTRFVGVAFLHEDFTIIHPFVKNDHGVFFCVVPIPLGEREILYRIVSDGLWMSDPSNPDTVTDGRGIRLSRITIPKEREAQKPYPSIESDRSVEFVYIGPPGRQVSIEGSFNAWDPFMYQLKETDSGVYSIRLRLPAGRNYYRFVVNGNPIPDTRNLNRAIDQNGREVSEIIVPN
ncbi:MAG TPA: hypothetical protein PLG43_08510 [Spirochaetia bacterium]|jgi:hypothetical protein|nr:hypothetical protein [Spirochaetia bacterium]